MDARDIAEALSRLGALLTDGGEETALVVVGGASLALLGIVSRTTADVDVIARAGSDRLELEPPDPLPSWLTDRVARVARDLGLPADWLNTEVARQWRTGLPPGLAQDVTWRRYGSLRIGLVGRTTLIALKLFAATDRGPKSVHVQDLIALRPTREELEEAARWVRTQDAAPAFGEMVGDVVAYVDARRHG